MSDHALILSYDEGDLSQLQIPPETLYHRWNINITFGKGRNSARINSVNLSNPQRATQCRCNNCDLVLYCPSISQRYYRHPAPISPDVYGDIDVDDNFLVVLTMPICRGGPYGVVGNGSVYSRAKSMLRDVKVHGELPENWKDILLDADSLQCKDLSYYKCPGCVDVLC
ncbi:hypothetical protein BDR03DRAFT_1096177 [Suillus americanus]|nr:hypothetical protein BDR03DRAFT_1096177 [Suillus americanus]